MTLKIIASENTKKKPEGAFAPSGFRLKNEWSVVVRSHSIIRTFTEQSAYDHLVAVDHVDTTLLGVAYAAAPHVVDSLLAFSFRSEY